MNGKNICIITYPYDSSEGATPTILASFIHLIEMVSNHVYVITGNYAGSKNNSTFIIKIYNNDKKKNFIFTIFQFLINQIRVMLQLMKVQKNVDLFLFYLGARTLVLPMIVAKIFRKKVFIITVGALIDTGYNSSDNNNYFKIKRMLLFGAPSIITEINYKLCDKIIVYSESMISDLNLEKYRYKIIIGHEHNININTFTQIIPFPERPFLIGYIGRLSEEKGIQNFVSSIPTIFSEYKDKDLGIFIGGNGPLYNSIYEFVNAQKNLGRIQISGWIFHDDLPRNLNQLRLLVLPSYTEGLPNIILEAMACGTPVLATPVGAIPNVIRDGETGFIMETNSPECIARNIIRAMNSPNLEKIANNGRLFIEEHFTFEKTAETWKNIFEDVD